MTTMTIDEYLARAPHDQRIALQRLRAQIRAAAPGTINFLPAQPLSDELVTKLVQCRLAQYQTH